MEAERHGIRPGVALAVAGWLVVLAAIVVVLERRSPEVALVASDAPPASFAHAPAPHFARIAIVILPCRSHRLREEAARFDGKRIGRLPEIIERCRAPPVLRLA